MRKYLAVALLSFACSASGTVTIPVKICVTVPTGDTATPSCTTVNVTAATPACPVCPTCAVCPVPVPVPTPTPTPTPAPTTSADADFAARCAGTGVLVCNGLNTTADLAPVPPGDGLGAANDGTIQGSIDATNSTSGGGSLMFRLRKGITAANIGGYWSTSLGKAFGSGSTVYIQWRQKVSPEYLTNNSGFWHSSIKQNIVHGTSATCQATEYVTLVTPNTAGTNAWSGLFTNCGDGMNTTINADGSSGALCNGCPGYLQQGSLDGAGVAGVPGTGYYCDYQNQFPGDGTGKGCFYPTPGVWYTYYEKISFGQQGGATASVDAYVALGGGPYREFQRATGIPWFTAPDTTYQLYRFETYMTELARGGSAAPVDAFVWYDELIISTQPIPAPNN